MEKNYQIQDTVGSVQKEEREIVLKLRLLDEKIGNLSRSTSGLLEQLRPVLNIDKAMVMMTPLPAGNQHVSIDPLVLSELIRAISKIETVIDTLDNTTNELLV